MESELNNLDFAPESAEVVEQVETVNHDEQRSKVFVHKSSEVPVKQKELEAAGFCVYNIEKKLDENKQDIFILHTKPGRDTEAYKF